MAKKDNLSVCEFSILRYVPDIVRGEFLNIGVFLYASATGRLEARFLDNFRRVKRLHPWADIGLLASLEDQFDRDRVENAQELKLYLELLQSMSNTLQLSEMKGVLTADFDAELDRLYETYVREPRYPTRLAATVENTRAWVRSKLTAALRSAGLLPRLGRRVSVAAFTQPGDPFAFDFGYRTDSRRGFIHALALARELDRAKVVAYTAERVRTRLEAEQFGAEFTAVVEAVPTLENAAAQLSARILREQEIALVPVAELTQFTRTLSSQVI